MACDLKLKVTARKWHHSVMLSFWNVPEIRLKLASEMPMNVLWVKLSNFRIVISKNVFPKIYWMIKYLNIKGEISQNVHHIGQLLLELSLCEAINLRLQLHNRKIFNINYKWDCQIALNDHKYEYFFLQLISSQHFNWTKMETGQFVHRACDLCLSCHTHTFYR